MSIELPLVEDGHFDKVEYQGKIINVGDSVIIQQAGQEKVVVVSGIKRQQGHYWVGYDENNHFCPWPLVRLSK